MLDGMSRAKALLLPSYGENSELVIFRISDGQLDEIVPNRTKL